MNQKTKAMFSGLLQALAWKWRGPILVWTLHKFVTYLLTYLDTYPLIYSPMTHMKLSKHMLPNKKMMNNCKWLCFIQCHNTV